MNNEYSVITLCGSTKFKDEFLEAERALSLAGFIVLSVKIFTHADGESLTPQQVEMFKAMHKQKIDMSDALVVINKDGYIGENTKNEIKYARSQGLFVYYMFVNCDTTCIHRGFGAGKCTKENLPFVVQSFKENKKLPFCPEYRMEVKCD